MPKFYTQYNNISKPSIAGKKIIQEYTRETNPVTGEIKLIKSGTRDIYNEIQEAGIGVTLKEIINKYETLTETEIIKTYNQQQFIDTTKYKGTNKAELEKNLKEAEANIEKIKKALAKETTNKLGIPAPEKTKANEPGEATNEKK